ncbi:hypothetical protein CDG77_13795 [Nostoc sp. 'Peltigera membranacea cyanobiont' 213]|uniref:DUF3122 domain-containing protein n=1 Tax=unclassified Nostoc TaxID=2593658 RepID=UPI000B9597EA|nr:MULTISPECIES: DUF3122 domain-containing protein [unclassified Nostoc]AVH64208.1 protein of unknown function DUF3122 [Nostoc sp. 'Peltigera membranacea cyanobiont' N6]OYD92823.1 hypothetical protein CDG77_13795 [Nostoc sp. 'Peltigera membranacea cyanobiont' 213]
MKSIYRFIGATLILGMLVWTLTINLAIAPARATIRQLEEAPGQMVYQSRQTLKDQHGNNWQAIAFKRTPPNGKTSLELRLVGFISAVEIDRSKPLLLADSMGKTLAADDTSSTLFTDLSAPESNVGQYDIQPLLPQLQPEIPLSLTVPAIGGEAINLSVPPSFVQDWQTLFSSRE